MKALDHRRPTYPVARCFLAGLLRSEAAALVWGAVEPEAADKGQLAARRSKTDPDAEDSVRYLPRAAMEALEAMRPQEADPEASVFGLSGRQIAKSVGTPRPPPGWGAGFPGTAVT